MAEILISAVLTDGAAVLFEVVEPATSGPVPRVRLPRYALAPDDPSIEDALAAGLLSALGVEVVEQEFVDTVYERVPGESEVRVNNLQLVQSWNGVVPERTAAGRELLWVPIEALPELNLPYDLCQALLGAFGMEAAPSLPAAAEPGKVIVLTGPAGAGKSTVGGLIARALPRCSLIRLDELRHMVVSGAPLPHWRGGEYAESYRFGLLAIRNAATLARSFAEAGFDAVVEGIFEQPEELDLFLAELTGTPAHFVTLLPELDEVVRRDQGRPQDEQMGGRSLEHHAIFSFGGEVRGLRIDSTGMSAEDTAAMVLDNLDQARVQ